MKNQNTQLTPVRAPCRVPLHVEFKKGQVDSETCISEAHHLDMLKPIECAEDNDCVHGAAGGSLLACSSRRGPLEARKSDPGRSVLVGGGSLQSPDQSNNLLRDNDSASRSHSDQSVGDETSVASTESLSESGSSRSILSQSSVRDGKELSEPRDAQPTKRVAFTKVLVTQINYRPKTTAEEWCKLYYTCHEIQRMWDESKAECGNCDGTTIEIEFLISNHDDDESG